MTSSHIPSDIRAAVRNRAGSVCEYCRLPQSCQEATFHIDHVVPRNAGGETALDNLALACVTCSLKKAARTRAVDDVSGVEAPLFNPRTDTWDEHFDWTADWHVQGLTPTGRATVSALSMNRTAIIAIRGLLADADRFPDHATNDADNAEQ